MAEYTINKFTFGGNTYKFEGTGGSSVPFSGSCPDAAATTAKTVTCPEFTSDDLVVGAIVFVTFTATNSGAVGSLTLNVNGTGAYPIKYNNSGTGSGNIGAAGNLVTGSTYPFYFDGTHWMILYNYNTNDDYRAYDIRHYRSTFVMAAALTRYKVIFTKFDGTLLPATAVSNSTATTKALTTQSFDPHGAIYYYSTTTGVAVGANPSASYLWQHFSEFNLGYSFNTGSTLVANHPVYIKCSPQSDGSVKLAGNDCIVQALPSTEDGYVYILLGQAYSTTSTELNINHPVYIYKDGAIRTIAGYIEDFKGPGVVNTDGVSGAVPAPTSSMMTPTNLYPGDSTTSIYWLNACGEWKPIPSASFDRCGIMTNIQYRNTYIYGLRGIWQNSTTSFPVSANSWAQTLIGTIPANTSDQRVFFKIRAYCKFPQLAANTQQMISIYYDGNHRNSIRAINPAANNTPFLETEYIIDRSEGAEAAACYLMVWSSVACTIAINDLFMYIQPIAWIDS